MSHSDTIYILTKINRPRKILTFGYLAKPFVKENKADNRN